MIINENGQGSLVVEIKVPPAPKTPPKTDVAPPTKPKAKKAD